MRRVRAVLLLSLACGLLVGAAWAAARGVRPHWLAFAAAEPGQPTDLYALDPARRRLVNLTHSPRAGEAQPAWSPDGSTLAFGVTLPQGLTSRRICTLPVETTGSERCFWSTGLLDGPPLWSPDGDRLLFTSSDPYLTLTTYVLDMRAGTARALPLGYGDAIDPNWSPDGAAIALAVEVEGVGQIVVTGPASARPRVLTATTQGANRQPVWSPDGQWIAYISGRDSLPRLYLVDLATARDEPLTPGGAYEYFPAWSPDGTRVAFAAGPASGGLFQLRVVDVATREIRTLTDASFRAASPAWSPDNAQIAFLGTRSGAHQIGLLTLATGQVEWVTPRWLLADAPAWRP